MNAAELALAVCLDHDPEVMFPDDRAEPTDLSVLDAKAVCAGCPIREACLQGALERGERHGVWGGMTVKERSALKRRHYRAVEGTLHDVPLDVFAGDLVGAGR